MPDSGTVPVPVTQRERVLSLSGVAALAFGLLLLLGMVGGSVWLAVRNAEGMQAAERTARVRDMVSEVILLAQDAETGQRGYLLTGKEPYLAPYDAAAQRLPPLLDALAQQARGGETRRLLDLLRAAIDTKVAELRETIALYRAGDRDAALALVQTDQGKARMDEIRRLTSAMAAEQQAALLGEIGAIEQRGHWLVRAATGGVLLVLALGGLVAYGMLRAMQALRLAQSRLSDANAGLELENETLEAAVDRRTADLREANQESQRFAYIVSHDLRAPLVNIIGFTGELEASLGTLRRFVVEGGDSVPASVRLVAEEDLPEAIGFIKTSTAKMDRLIGAILRLSREGRRSFTAEPLHMRGLLGSIAASLQQQVQAAEAEITVGDVPDLVADRVAMEQVFTNLIENALKYRDPSRPPRIRVSGRRDGAMAVFEVADNGRGIAERDRERVFEPFRRAGNQDVPGEGIGLAHVRALVRRLGGTIGFTSAVGEGTTFRITLPLRMEPVMDAA